MTTALVTGASAGLGAEFCRQLAATGHDLVLVARSADRLEALAATLRDEHGVRVETLPADIADRSALQAVAGRLAGDGPGASGAGPVDLLVNNAGFGIGTSFTRTPIGEEERALDVMCRAVLVLSHAAAAAMAPRGRGGILKVSSVAGFTAMGTYSATKAWVTTFSEALADELAPTGVRVSAVCPGFTHTEFHDRAAMNMSRLPDGLWLDAPDVVAAALDGLRRGRPVVVPGAHYRALTGVMRVLPRSVVTRVAGGLGRARRTDSGA